MKIQIVAALTLVSLVPALAQISSAPYSAVQVTERIQTLADGTHITNRGQTKVLMYRDSQGRTRMEIHPAPLQVPPGVTAPERPTIVNIFDPVAGFHYMMDSATKIAHRMEIPKTPAVPAMPSAVGVGVSVTMIPGGAPPLPPTSNRPQIKSESMGTQVIDGLIADGQRITTTYPAGAIGNDRDIVVIRETWNSQELRVPLLAKSSDPRMGDTITKLTDINRSEPDPLLFAIPPDYTIQDQPAQTPPKQ